VTKKCEFLSLRDVFLGYVVSCDGTQVDESKTEVIKLWPIPSSITLIRRFHSLASFQKKGSSKTSIPSWNPS